jgi:protein SCO1/2
MADYVHAFDPAFRGVTGSVQDIDALAAAVGIAHRKVPMGDQYMVDHTAAVMLVDPRGRRVAVFSPPLDAAGIASDVRRAVATGTASG